MKRRVYTSDQGMHHNVEESDKGVQKKEEFTCPVFKVKGDKVRPPPPKKKKEEAKSDKSMQEKL